MSRCFDKPLVTWNECTVGDYDSPEGVVVALPHSADRLDVGLAIRQTEWGAQCMPDPGPGEVTLRVAWARLLTLREQWEWQGSRRGVPPATDDPPEGWWPQEGTPSWIEDPHGDEVWNRDVDDVTWRRDIAAAIALHDLVTAGHFLVPSDQLIETARVGVVAAIDRAVAAGVPEADIDAVLEGMGPS